MTGYPVWGALNRALNDPTVIDQAIAEAIAAHNDEPEAHMAADQSIETHRQNDIIDHPAESVVNDKVKPNARAYVAIVDPDSETDFDTIESAVSYALTVGGGVVLIMPGVHYLTDTLHIDRSITLQGIDRDLCKIIMSHSNGTGIDIFGGSSGSPLGDGDVFISDLTIEAGSNYLITAQNLVINTVGKFTVYVERCILTANEAVFFTENAGFCLRDCNVYIGYVISQDCYASNTIDNCNIFALSSGCQVGYSLSNSLILNTRFWSNGKTNITWIGSTGDFNRFSNCYFESYGNDANGLYETTLNSCTIRCNGTNQFRVSDDRAELVNCRITRVTIATGVNKTLALGCRTSTAITNSGTNSVLSGNIVN